MRAKGFYKPKVKKEWWAGSNGHCAWPTGSLLNAQWAAWVETNRVEGFYKPKVKKE